jgi:hypothetical protein
MALIKICLAFTLAHPESTDVAVKGEVLGFLPLKATNLGVVVRKHTA